jgi:hypothetical protein
MISVIICSINADLLKNVHDNIQKTIGVPFEILSFDNSVIKNGICKVYNDLAHNATYPYLCFLHEDVILQTENWGKIIVDTFLKDASTGLIGIAGSKYKSAYFSGWYTSIKELDCANYLHQYPDKQEKVLLTPDKNKNLQEVVCLDGVFICCKKEIWKNILFNEEFLKGFHFYDIDFSVRAAKFYKLFVTFEIELVHITSGGDYSDNWVETAVAYHENMRSILPFSKIVLNRKETDERVIIATMDHLKQYKISFRNKIRWINLQKLLLNPSLYYHIIKFFLYKPLGLKKIHSNLKSR